MVAGPFTLQILHASDFEAGVEAVQDAPNLAAIVDRLEDQSPNSITLSSGDNFIPSPFFNASGDPALARLFPPNAGRGDIRILNLTGVEASVLGNHEFDAGPRELANIISRTTDSSGVQTYEGAQFPYLSANLDFSGDADLNPLFTPMIRRDDDFRGPTPAAAPGAGARRIAPATIIEENGQLIGVVGVTTPLLPGLSSVGGVRVRDLDGVNDTEDFQELAAIIQPTIDALTAQGITQIILLSHLQQVGFEQQLIPFLRNVDIVIGGGSNTLLADATDPLRPGDSAQGPYPLLINNADGRPTALVNTDGNYQYVSRLVVTFDAGGNIIPSSIDPAVSGAYETTTAGVNRVYDGPDADSLPDTDPFAAGSRGARVREVTDTINSVITAKDGNTFGRTDVFIDGRRGEVRTEETNLGNLSSDANIFAGRQADPTVMVSIKNGGGIRDSIGSFASVPGSTTAQEQGPAANPAAGKELGEISQLDIENSLRFNNSLTLITLTPQQLLQTLEHSVAATAPGAQPGQFAQVGGVAFSFDPRLPVGNRVNSVALVDESGQVTSVVVRDSEVVADAPGAIRIVTLNFLVDDPDRDGRGGDNYPFPSFVAADPTFANRVDLTTALAGRPGAASFAAPGTEQDALAEYLAARFATTPFGEPDTGPVGDRRIQNLTARGDAVLAPTFTGTAGNDTLRGSAADETLNGLAGNDTLIGNAGKDVLYGGDGNDRLDGGDGNDALFGQNGNDTLFGGGGEDELQGEEGDDRLEGEAGLDRLGGGDGNDRLAGGDSDDVLFGGTGNDELFGDDGQDTLSGENGQDRLSGGRGNDRLFGNDGEDELNGDDGDDRLEGGSGLDRLGGGGGDDRLFGGDNDDQLFGGAGGDQLFGEAGNDALSGEGGNDRLEGGAGADRLFGNEGDDLLVGGDANDLLFGGSNNDRLEGAAGNDRLSGEAGNDVLVGGAGSDTFVFETNFGSDRVLDFQGEDVIEFSAGRFANFGAVQARASQSGANTLIEDGGQTLIIENVSVGSLVADDFRFV